MCHLLLVILNHLYLLPTTLNVTLNMINVHNGLTFRYTLGSKFVSRNLAGVFTGINSFVSVGKPTKVF
jgi:hypothetical protein